MLLQPVLWRHTGRTILTLQNQLPVSKPYFIHFFVHSNLFEKVSWVFELFQVCRTNRRYGRRVIWRLHNFLTTLSTSTFFASSMALVNGLLCHKYSAFFGVSGPDFSSHHFLPLLKNKEDRHPTWKSDLTYYLNTDMLHTESISAYI